MALPQLIRQPVGPTGQPVRLATSAGARPRFGYVLARLTVVALLLVAGCQSGGRERVRGVVIAVESTSPARADAVTVRTDDGRELRFRVDPGERMTPGHLREHMATAEPVVVDYVEQADGLLAVRIEDG